jgi:hypothetical protein
MSTYQTTVQDSNQIRFGSAKVEVGATIGTLVNLGAAQGVKFEEKFDVVYLVPDNAPKSQIAIKNHEASVSFSMMEVNLSNLNLIRGGMDTYATVVGSATPVSAETHTLNDTNFVRLDHKNGDGTEVASIVVTDSADGAAVRNTDYVIVVDEEGWTCIARVAASTVITDGDGVKVSYSYTPSASRTLSSGGKNTIAPRVVRLTNTNAAGQKFEITVYSATSEGGIALEFPSDDGDEPMMPETTLIGVCDATRTAGDQLFKVVDEQGVTA